MATIEIKMPDVGEGVTQAEIVEWHVKTGDTIKEDDVIADVMTDKATIEIPAPQTGTIASTYGEVGEMIPVGTIITVIDALSSGVKTEQVSEAPVLETVGAEEVAPPPAAPIPSAPSLPPARTSTLDEKATASPAVRKIASENGVNLRSVPATGRDGRVTKGDLLAFLKNGASPLSEQRKDEVIETKVVGLRRVISERMQDAKSRIAHFTYVEEVDVTEVEKLRQHLNENREEDQPKLTLLPFIMTAMVRALEKYPHLNAHYDDENGMVRQFSAAHIGFATQTDGGLMVPVLKHAERCDVWCLGSEIKRLSEAARSGKALPAELSGSTITLSSLGAAGGIAATPVINSPEVAIVGVNKMVTKPHWDGQQFVPRQVMNLSSSFDHRIIDGWDAAMFIQAMKAKLEMPATLFM